MIVRLGIVGVGNMGGVHVANIEQTRRGTLTAVCDVDPRRLERFKDTGVKTYLDADELINSGEVDAVIVSTPHYDHTTIGIQVLQAGLHLMVEKPISVHKADCERLIAAHTDPSRKFAAMFNQRTEPRYQRVRRLLKSGDWGEIRRVNWIVTDWFRTETYYRSGGWRATWAGEGGGVLMNQCPHNLDMLQWLCGMPSKVHAQIGLGKYHEIEVEDEVTAYLEWDHGATGVFITSTGEAPGTNRLEICTDRGKLVVEGEVTFRRTEDDVRQVRETSPELFASLPTLDGKLATLGVSNQHLVVLQNFVDAILDDVPLIAPAHEGIHSVELANAMIWSGLQGQAVELPIDASGYESKLRELIAASNFEKQVDESGMADMSASFQR